MQPLTNRVKKLEPKEMTFAEKAYLPAIFQGLSITMRHFFKKKATVQYPEVVRPMSNIFRGLHVLKRDVYEPSSDTSEGRNVNGEDSRAT